jgi:hypothetical protein
MADNPSPVDPATSTTDTAVDPQTTDTTPAPEAPPVDPVPQREEPAPKPPTVELDDEPDPDADPTLDDETTDDASDLATALAKLRSSRNAERNTRRKNQALKAEIDGYKAELIKQCDEEDKAIAQALPLNLIPAFLARRTKGTPTAAPPPSLGSGDPARDTPKPATPKTLYELNKQSLGG